MSVSKKDFEAIAKIIGEYSWVSPDTFEGLANDLADYFKTQNHLFDRRRFMKACGYDEVKE